jgi:hypothetical protein
MSKSKGKIMSIKLKIFRKPELRLMIGSKEFNEHSTGIVEFYCYNIEGVLAVPTYVSYLTYCETNEMIINGPSLLDQAPSSSTITIDISGSDTEIIDDGNVIETRTLVVSAGFDDNYQAVETFRFNVRNIEVM